jgi:nucleotide-binding universal stress UspA family protein
VVRLWGTKAREEKALSQSALGTYVEGGIVVVLSGERLDTNLVTLGCQMAKGAKRKVYLVYVIEVPRSLPLKAILTQESERADKLMAAAMEIAARIGCEAVEYVVQARATGPVIIDEANDHHCALILLGSSGQSKQVNKELDKTVSYVLEKAPCRVWLIQDPHSGAIL